jgi:hypothetical protein
MSGDPELAPTASGALRTIGNDTVLERLITVARGQRPGNGWILATLGRLPAERVRAALQGDPSLDRFGAVSCALGSSEPDGG